jgi:hypothetical protein
MSKVSKEQLETYIRNHPIEVSDKGSVTMNGCYLTLATDNPAEFPLKEDRDGAVWVGKSPDGRDFYVIPGLAGDLRLLAMNDIDEIGSYRDFDKTSTSNVACYGFSRSNKGWIGWSHRGWFMYKVGHVVKQGDIVTLSGWLPSYEAEHPEKCFNLEPGFVCKTLEDCKRCAIAHAMAIS